MPTIWFKPGGAAGRKDSRRRLLQHYWRSGSRFHRAVECRWRRSTLVSILTRIARSIVWQCSRMGKILLGGDFNLIGGVRRATAFARLNTNGTLDTNFNPNASSYVYSMAVQPDGKMHARRRTSPRWRRDAQLHRAGQCEWDARTSASIPRRTPRFQHDGAGGWKDHPGGNFNQVGGATRDSVSARLDVDGAADIDFHPDADGYVYSTAVQADGKVLVSGDFSLIDGVPSPLHRTN